jgi:putative oxidoreductase
LQEEYSVVDKDRLLIPALAAIYNRLAPFSYAFIRIVIALMFLVGGIDKIFHGGAARIAAGNITTLGLKPPYAWAWAVTLLEFFGAILLGLGLFTRPVAFALTVELTVIAFGIMALRGFFWTTGGMEVALLMKLRPSALSSAAAAATRWMRGGAGSSKREIAAPTGARPILTGSIRGRHQQCRP